jgi:uncharacterized protein YqeY
LSILEQLQDRAKVALKAGRKEEVSSTRYLVSELQKAAKDGGTPLDEDAEIKLLRRERKRRQEAIEAFRSGNRDDLAEREEAEVRLIDEFLPEQLDETAVAALIDEVIVETEATSAKDMGKVMSRLMERAGGQVDGKTASRLVRERLGG